MRTRQRWRFGAGGGSLRAGAEEVQRDSGETLGAAAISYQRRRALTSKSQSTLRTTQKKINKTALVGCARLQDTLSPSPGGHNKNRHIHLD